MQRTTKIGALVFLLFSLLLISTFPVSYSREQIQLGSQSLFPGRIELSIPKKVFLGQIARVRLRIQIEQKDGETENSTITARFESNLEEVSPRGEMIVILQADKPVALTWRFKPYTLGSYLGTLWIFADGQDDNQLILAREITIETRPFIFTRVENIRIPSGFGMGAGAVLFLFGFKKPR